MGKNELIENTLLFTPNTSEIIEAKSCIKDLGVLIDRDMKYKSQIQSVVAKANKKAGWILRTFKCRDIVFLRKLWKVMVQCHLDYGNVVWAPFGRRGDMRTLESPLRAFTRKGNNMYKLNILKDISSIKKCYMMF